MSVAVRIAYISLNREILSEPVQTDGLYVGRVMHPRKAGRSREWHRTGSGEDLRRVVQENFVNDTGVQGGPVDHRTAFDQQAGDLQFSQKMDDALHARPTVRCSGWKLLHADAAFTQNLFP